MKMLVRVGLGAEVLLFSHVCHPTSARTRGPRGWQGVGT